jgi:hypothetical protein
MTINLPKEPAFVRKVRNVRVAFWLPFGKLQTIGPIGRQLDLRNFSGICLAFEGKKWGIEDLLYFGGGQVSTPFTYGKHEWTQGQKCLFSLIHIGARRVLHRYDWGSVWAVGGFAFSTASQKGLPAGAKTEEYKIEGSTPYIGADWRHVFSTKTFKASPTEGGLFYGQFSARAYPFALSKVGDGGVLSINLSIGVLIGQNLSLL